MHRITILILSVNEAPLLRWSLPAACSQGADDVVVIDNACTDATPELCEQFGARRLRLPRRRGYAAAMNAGVAACGGDWVLLCNADCVLDDGFVEALRPHEPSTAERIKSGAVDLFQRAAESVGVRQPPKADPLARLVATVASAFDGASAVFGSKADEVVEEAPAAWRRIAGVFNR